MARCRDEARPARHVPVVVPDPRGSDSPQTRTRRRNASGGGRDARVGFPVQAKGGSVTDGCVRRGKQQHSRCNAGRVSCLGSSFSLLF
uniref:Uncharacterized protein n=1 Tax=Oryza barthii TaxID=65489 RepID=A0A0D3H7X0_9ORYZ